MMKIFLTFFLFLALPIISFAQDVERSFIARAYQSTEVLEKLVIKDSLTENEKCEWQLESTYLAFGDPKISDVVIRPTYKDIMGDEARSYKMVILDENKEIGFQMNYVYEKNSDQFPIGAEVYVIKDGWVAKILPAFRNQIVVNSPKCTFWFNLLDPFDSRSEAN
ncbi:MAG: hypothetical protein WDA09_04175 [Bacteriovoracaceae bacterium]